MNYYINTILKEKTITSYLTEKAILPQKKSGDKSMYCCPLHSGDNDPSFVVYPIGYKGREYETYYCFGCHSGITLINLKSDLERISTREVIKFYVKNIDIDNIDVRKSIVEDFKNRKLGIEENRSIEMEMLSINSYCRKSIAEEYKMDEDEIAFFEIFFQKVDDVARSRNFSLLSRIFDLLVEGNSKRSIEYKKRKEDGVTSSMNWAM